MMQFSISYLDFAVLITHQRTVWRSCTIKAKRVVHISQSNRMKQHSCYLTDIPEMLCHIYPCDGAKLLTAKKNSTVFPANQKTWHFLPVSHFECWGLLASSLLTCLWRVRAILFNRQVWHKLVKWLRWFTAL